MVNMTSHIEISRVKLLREPIVWNYAGTPLRDHYATCVSQGKPAYGAHQGTTVSLVLFGHAAGVLGSCKTLPNSPGTLIRIGVPVQGLELSLQANSFCFALLFWPLA